MTMTKNGLFYVFTKNQTARLAVIAISALSCVTSVTAADPIQVPRYDDADEYLPTAEKKNKDGIRLLLKQQSGEEIFKVLSPRNVLIDVVANVPKDANAAVVILLGGTGVLSIVNEKLDRSFSFQPRTRDYWWAQKFATFVVDAPSDRLGKGGIGDTKWRAGADHKTDLQAVMVEINKRFAGPLVVFGHSNGAISLGNVATLGLTGVKAYLFSSPAHVKTNTDILTEVEYKAPVLLFEHKKDSCSGSMSKDAEPFFNSLKAPSKKLYWVEGGSDPISGPCGPFGYHSYFGVEKQTIDQMATEVRKLLN